MTDLEPLTDWEAGLLAKQESIIERELDGFYNLGMALMTIRENRLYRSKHSTFQDYCRERWDMDRSHATRLIDGARIIKELGEDEDPRPVFERQTRELSQITDKGKRREAWHKAVRMGGRRPSSSIVRRAVNYILGRDKLPPKRPVKDGEGRPVPEALFQTFKGNEIYADLVRRLAQIKSESHKLAQREAGVYILIDELSQRLTESMEMLSFSKPHAPCPICSGGREACEACKGLGWLPKQHYENVKTHMEQKR